MPNPQLSEKELAQARRLIEKIRKEIGLLARGSDPLLFAFRRKIYKELMYDERSKPAARKRLKEAMYKKQSGKCALCGKNLPRTGSVLDRKRAIVGYVARNVRLLCHECDARVQAGRKYK